MHINETNIVLMVFVVLLLFGLVFYVRETKQHIDELKSSEKIKRSLLLMNSFLSSSEFQCSSNNRVDINCLDVDKLMSFSRLMNNEEFRDYYNEMFKDSRISIRQIYPTRQDIISYNFSEIENGIVRYVPVSLYFRNRGNAIGFVVVEVF